MNLIPSLIIGFIVQLIFEQTTVAKLSYNQLEFSFCAAWDPNGTTIATSTLVGVKPTRIFVDNNSTLYVTSKNLNRTMVVPEGSNVATRNISTGLFHPSGIFVTSDGDIYIANGGITHRVEKWALNATSGVIAMNTTSECSSLFIDTNDTLYCAYDTEHKVVKMSLKNHTNTVVTAAGNGTNGSEPSLLSYPNGIFVDNKFNLYVADYGNDRIQYFYPNQLNGTSITGAGSITLSRPTDVLLDADGCMFIVDLDNHRILQYIFHVFRCIIGCSGTPGSGPNQLQYPFSFAFDSYGNLIVNDKDNNRIQKFFLITNSCVVSYNQPKFCAKAKWNPNATTFATNTIVGSQPHAVFVNTNNSVYSANLNNGIIFMWLYNSVNVTNVFVGNLSLMYSIFVTSNGDIYSSSDLYGSQVRKYSADTNAWSTRMHSSSSCYGLFVDVNNNLYCSMRDNNIVVRSQFNDNTSTSTTVAGKGTAAATPDALDYPLGIFVDVNFDLYVADCGNDRIQLFQLGIINGTTVAGNQSTIQTISLNCPAGIVLDAENYLFIVDQINARIVGSGPYGFRCLVGCTGISGAEADQLYWPLALSFDTYGNMFVSDINNNRIQKFIFLTNSCYTSMAVSFTTDITTTLYSAQSSQSTWKNSTGIGLYYNISDKACDYLQPCYHNGFCYNNNSNVNNFYCLCPYGFTGDQCQLDKRLCRLDTCWNNGTCSETSNTTYSCYCQPGWQDDRCKTKVNYCSNVTCYNHGVCRPLVLDYQCQCLAGSFSGRHCEIVASTTKIHRILSKSFVYIAIMAMITVVMLVIIMDILKYGFHIEPSIQDLDRAQRDKQTKKRMQRFRPRYRDTLVVRKIAFLFQK
ncbi:unnamed protein product [Adineta ricciae]|uniref:EGF-like domain-containing protein n=1 Tax=Adineta ricciae TaxID=249248 RepID=A0A815KQJ9_ADIRI|nr:unnamed protein product [Adineta ricciae]CAF1399436.1 unnamed protein product [Adineta ricciae]